MNQAWQTVSLNTWKCDEGFADRQDTSKLGKAKTGRGVEQSQGIIKPFSSAQNCWDKFPKQFKRTYKRSDGLKQEKLHHAKFISSEERVDRVEAIDAILICQAMAVWPFPIRKARKSLKGLREGSVPSWTCCILGRGTVASQAFQYSLFRSKSFNGFVNSRCWTKAYACSICKR